MSAFWCNQLTSHWTMAIGLGGSGSAARESVLQEVCQYLASALAAADIGLDISQVGRLGSLTRFASVLRGGSAS